MEKILKRPDGKQVKISVSFYQSGVKPDTVYTLHIQYRLPGKRKWQSVYSTDDFTYRRLTPDGRRLYEMREFQKHATPDEIYQATKEYWETLAPPPVPDLQDVED